MRVALIDDGVVPQVVPRLPARNDLCVLEDGTIRQRRQDEPVLTDHGTTSAQILHMYAPEAEICSLRIFSSPKLRASVGQLAAALEWCWREKIPLIHLSLGTTLSSDYELLCPILARLIRGNQMVVAAHSNRDAYTVPACLMGVLGVSADPQMSGYQYAVQDAAGPEQVQITASSRHALTSPTGRVYETQVTNSYAAPVVTAAVHELLRKSPPLSLTVAEVYEKLAGRQVDISRSGRILLQKRLSTIHPRLRSARRICFLPCGLWRIRLRSGGRPSGNILGFLPSFFRLPLGRGWTPSWIGCMKSNAQGFCAQARFLPKAACHRFFFGRKAAAKASRNTSFPQIAPASQSHRPARPLYTWQRRCKENSRRMDMDVPWFRTCRRPISMGQHICTGTRVAHPEFLPGPGIPKQTYGFSVPRENQTVIRAFRSKHPAC